MIVALNYIGGECDLRDADAFIATHLRDAGERENSRWPARATCSRF